MLLQSSGILVFLYLVALYLLLMLGIALRQFTLRINFISSWLLLSVITSRK